MMVRKARKADMAAVGRLGAALVRQHHAFDVRRFIDPGDDIESGYSWFLGTQLKRDDVVLLVAESEGEVVGYLYGAIEPHSWKELRDEAGFIHDVVVDDKHRGHGVATALIQAAGEWFMERGMPRMLLWTAEANEHARKLFERIGFRRTMVEMTREL